MADFRVPELGENVAGGDVTRILVNVGDTITRDQPVLELETDKATIEVPSSVAGVVKTIQVKKGDKIKVGAVVLTVDEGAAAVVAPPPAVVAPAAVPVAAAPVVQPPPQLAVQDQKVVAMPPRQATPPAPEPMKTGPLAPAAPSVRRLAREIGVDINQVQGSDDHGRITQDDVKEHARRVLSSIGSGVAARGTGHAPTIPMPDFRKWGEFDRQPISNIRRVTAERLSHAWNVIPHVTQFDKADITAMEELRKRFREQVAKAGGNLTVTAMLVKVLAAAVQKFPQFNASLDSQNGEIVYKKYINVGVAVDTDRGLLVPVIRNADTKTITQIAIEINHAAERAREKKLSLDDMSGGGITISNLGGLGGTYFTPIVNWPEVAILGVSRGVIEPVWRTNTFEPRQMLPLSLSYDHRVIDGADAIRFLRWVVEAIEQHTFLSVLG
ncbi:MAG: branched-chain alpha-keto acid dehydrogenase subunit E2 [Acidobacteria bacterium]|nr:branched-chain alpha-keto acid dehydrogenase subunit E2 [Acidobacteriota bacterium]